jgi:hypothetical protein
MVRATQLGVAVGTLGFILILMGLFPGVTGARPAAGVGAVQFMIIWTGFTLLIMGALIYVRYGLGSDDEANLTRQIGIRLAWTGLIFIGMAGLADFLGFGSHTPSGNADALFGQLQLVGVIGGFLLSSLGIALYALGFLSSSKS